jgi:hypothetical protein
MSEDTPSPPEQTRQCDNCKQVKPLNKKHFPRLKGTQHNFQWVCRPCKTKIKQQAKMEGLERAAIGTYLSRTVSGGSNIPHTAELLEGIMHYFGGANGFASLVMKQYFESAPGSRMRNSLLEMVVRLASKNTEQGGAKKPIDLYSEEELEAEIDKRLRQAVLTYGGVRHIDVEEEKPNPALPAPDSPEHIELPAGRVEELAERASREAHRSLAALQADREAERVSPLPVE